MLCRGMVVARWGGKLSLFLSPAPPPFRHPQLRPRSTSARYYDHLVRFAGGGGVGVPLQVLMSEGTHPGEVSRQLAAGVCVRSNDHVAAVSIGGAALGMTPHGVPPGGPGLASNSGGGSVEGCTLMGELDGSLAALLGAGGGAGSGGGGVAPPELSPPAPPAQSLRTVSAHDKAWLIASITKQYL